MTDYIKIFLDRHRNSFQPGQTLTGKVQCVFSSEKNVRAIKVKFKGRARTRWTVKRGKSKTVYYAEEIYFDQELILVGGEGNDLHIPAGLHLYPFSYTLPQTLPSSFAGSHGNIKYKIKATVDRPWSLDHEDELLFIVTLPLDLNHSPAARNPFSKLIEESVSSCCTDPGTITFSISLLFTGYAVNQRIDVRSYIQNMSNINVERVEYKIKRLEEFIAHRPRNLLKFNKCIIDTTSTGAIGAHAEESWTASLTVPSGICVTVFPCNIIRVTYTLQVKVILPWPHSNLKISCPLMFGTNPLINDPPAELAFSNASAPPSYEESIARN